MSGDAEDKYSCCLSCFLFSGKCTLIKSVRPPPFASALKYRFLECDLALSFEILFFLLRVSNGLFFLALLRVQSVAYFFFFFRSIMRRLRRYRSTTDEASSEGKLATQNKRAIIHTRKRKGAARNACRNKPDTLLPAKAQTGSSPLLSRAFYFTILLLLLLLALRELPRCCSLLLCTSGPLGADSAVVATRFCRPNPSPPFHRVTPTLCVPGSR